MSEIFLFKNHIYYTMYVRVCAIIYFKTKTDDSNTNNYFKMRS